MRVGAQVDSKYVGTAVSSFAVPLYCIMFNDMYMYQYERKANLRPLMATEITKPWTINTFPTMTLTCWYPPWLR